MVKLQRANINLVENKLILSPEWGSITGDITEQEDLISALDDKANKEDVANKNEDVIFEKSVTVRGDLNADSIIIEGKSITDYSYTKEESDSKYADINGNSANKFRVNSLTVGNSGDSIISTDGTSISFLSLPLVVKQTLPKKSGTILVESDLNNYYNKKEIDNKLSNLDLSIFEIVNELPTSNINENKIYLVRNEQTTGSNLYTEYRYTNNSWEVIGEYKSDIDLSDYYTKSETDSLLANKANTADVYNKSEIDDLIASSLTNYYTKSNTYSKSEIDTKIGDIETILATI